MAVREEDMTAECGYAHIDGAAEPVALAAATHVGCCGVVQRVVLGDDDRISSLGIVERVFKRC